MKHPAHTLAFTLLSLLATGCSHHHPDPDRQQVPGAGLLSDQGDGYAVDGTTFRVTPTSIRVCEHPDLRMSVDVTWDGSPAGARTVGIWVDDGHSGPKKWFYGGSTGHAKTGNWIGDNTTLRMTDGENGRTLALRRIHVTQCLVSPPATAPLVD